MLDFPNNLRSVSKKWLWINKNNKKKNDLKSTYLNQWKKIYNFFENYVLTKKNIK